MQLKLFDTGRKSDAPGQTLMFEDENQRPREAPPLVRPATTGPCPYCGRDAIIVTDHDRERIVCQCTAQQHISQFV